MFTSMYFEMDAPRPEFGRATSSILGPLHLQMEADPKSGQDLFTSWNGCCLVFALPGSARHPSTLTCLAPWIPPCCCSQQGQRRRLCCRICAERLVQRTQGSVACSEWIGDAGVRVLAGGGPPRQEVRALPLVGAGVFPTAVVPHKGSPISFYHRAPYLPRLTRGAAPRRA